MNVLFNCTISLKLDSDHRHAHSKLPVIDNIVRLRLTSVQTNDHIRFTRRSIELRVFSDTTVHPKSKALTASYLLVTLMNMFKETLTALQCREGVECTCFAQIPDRELAWN
jgi:hypothetical protein